MMKFSELPVSARAGLAGPFSVFGVRRMLGRWQAVFTRIVLRAPQDAFDCAITALAQPGQRVLVAGAHRRAIRHRIRRACGGDLDVCMTEAVHMTTLGFDAALPFEDASFDLVCCGWGLEQAVRPLLALRELMRVLAPGQTLCFVARADLGSGGPGVRLARTLVRLTGKARPLSRDDLTAMAIDDPQATVCFTHLRKGAVLGLVRKGGKRSHRRIRP